MTKAHLKCIDTVKHLLTPEQFKTLLELASSKQRMQKAKAQPEAKKVDMESEGAKMFQAKCAMCHSTSRPTDMSKVVAPAVMGVMNHVKIKYPEKDKAIAFMKDYVLNPSADKAVCMPQRLRDLDLCHLKKVQLQKKS